MNIEQANLKISRYELQKVADFLPYPFIIAEVIDGNHLNTHLNEKFKEEISYTLDEIPTLEAWYKMAYPNKIYREKVISDWDSQEAEYLNGDKIFVRKKALVTCKNGIQRWYEIKASVMGNIHVVAFIDLDKEIALQEELKSINVNNDRMLSILGHDLRSPVANLMSLSTLAAKTEISKDEYSELIHQINGQSMQVLDMLENTLNWAKLNFNAVTISVSEIDFNILIQNVLSVYEPAYTSKNITVNVSAEHSELVKSDAEIATIIIRNLISNAIKFTPQNGTITIQSAKNNILIKDNGIGMPQNMVTDILSSQYVSRKGTDNEQGLGMGLQLVQNLAQKINCQLSIKSQELIGTEISLVFGSV